MGDDVRIDTVRSSSSGIPGRALNSARTQHFVLDSPSGPNEALTTAEAFLSGISACGVTLIEKYASESGVPVTRMGVTIHGARNAAGPAEFRSIDVSFEIAGVDQRQAEELVDVWKAR
jgi:uncharacterized OsmC-like protein